MKILNFTAVEVLPSLLDKTKIQTIRPAWKSHYDTYCKNCGYDEGRITAREVFNKSRCSACKHIYPISVLKKLPRFKVGEKVKLVWNQRSKYESFCTICGNPIETVIHKCNPELLKDFLINKTKKDYCDGCFDKLLGTAEITEVFEIEQGFYVVLKSSQPDKFIINSAEELAKKDGFKSAEEMFSWFNKKYDLSSPKEFWVYRWKYIL